MSSSDVQSVDIVAGQGRGFKTGDSIKLHYTLTLNGFHDQGGKVVDSSRSHGRTFCYEYNTGAVIKGWDIGVAGMKAGGRRKLIVPPNLGYGSGGVAGSIPPNSTLFFDIELIKVE